ncbi:hypothetical protein [Demequina soli]|uniref:hypothetical protein n=1 Tax=Demequina soli TaxID=1638987 RepID=UPI0007810049|nr:hypothetical protein [Demequina soli]
MSEQFDEDTEALVALAAEVEHEREVAAEGYDPSVDPEAEIDEEAPADGPVEPLDEEPDQDGDEAYQ